MEYDEGDLDSLTWLQDSPTANFENSAAAAAAAHHKRRSTSDDVIIIPSQANKRRLGADQVHYLEKCFEADNKLEPDRKSQLAKQIGLQPRQVAIWFQNRRARCKNKLLQKDYDVLNSKYDELKRSCDALSSENEELKDEFNMLVEKLRARGKGTKTSSEKSDVVDYYSDDSPRYCTDGIQSAAETAAISSDFEEGGLGKGMMMMMIPHAPPCFPKLEMGDDELSSCYDDDDGDDYPLQPNSCSNLGFPVQNHDTWFWQI